MTGKKIEFAKKPSKENTESFIDNWVSGEKKSSSVAKSLKRTTIYLPEDLRQELKLLALKEDTSMTEIIITTLRRRLN
jgi:tartrate dehydratase alpha subunit/fumarate hydratase class I-like protein